MNKVPIIYFGMSPQKYIFTHKTLFGLINFFQNRQEGDQDSASNGHHQLFSLMVIIFLIALLVGLVISLLQAVTQVQEQTLAFVPKIVAVIAVSIGLLVPKRGSVVR